MARARYQVLVIPYCIKASEAQFCLFRRSDMGIWQFIAGGGEDEDFSIVESAKREALEACCSIPSNCFKNAEAMWGRECFVIPEYAFAVKVENTSLKLSHEHTEYNWMTYEEAKAALQYDSNKTALWELNRRIELEMMQ